MKPHELNLCLRKHSVIAAISDDKWLDAVCSPANVLFYLSANLLSIKEKVSQAHRAGKIVMVHIDLAEGIGKDGAGISYLAQCGVDGIISTRANIIRLAKKSGLIAIQRVFALDSKGLDSIDEMIRNASPHMVEIMPGVISKAISRFSKGNIPIIAGGLLETKQEVSDALEAGAIAVSTSCRDLWCN